MFDGANIHNTFLTSKYFLGFNITLTFHHLASIASMKHTKTQNLSTTDGGGVTLSFVQREGLDFSGKRFAKGIYEESTMQDCTSS